MLAAAAAAAKLRVQRDSARERQKEGGKKNESARATELTGGMFQTKGK